MSQINSNRIRSSEEVYFLVRVGQMSPADLSAWLQENIDAAYPEDDHDNYRDDWNQYDDEY